MTTSSPSGKTQSLDFPCGEQAHIKRGVAAGRSAVYPEARLAARSGQRGTSGAATGGGGRSAPDPKQVRILLLGGPGAHPTRTRLLFSLRTSLPCRQRCAA